MIAALALAGRWRGLRRAAAPSPSRARRRIRTAAVTGTMLAGSALIGQHAARKLDDASRYLERVTLSRSRVATAPGHACGGTRPQAGRDHARSPASESRRRWSQWSGPPAAFTTLAGMPSAIGITAAIVCGLFGGRVSGGVVGVVNAVGVSHAGGLQRQRCGVGWRPHGGACGLRSGSEPAHRLTTCASDWIDAFSRAAAGQRIGRVRCIVAPAQPAARAAAARSPESRLARGFALPVTAASSGVTSSTCGESTPSGSAP